MDALIRFSLKQVVFYNLIFVLLIVAGAFALSDIPVERYPNVQMGEVLITTFYPGASPQDVESLVTQKIEEALEDVPDMAYIKSTSYRERSIVHLKFRDDTDYASLYDEVRFKVLGILGELPAGVEPPLLNDIDANDFIPAVSVNLSGPRGNRALVLIGEALKLRLQKIPGVKEIKLNGEYEREFHVYLDPHKLRALGVTFDEVAAALQQANLSVPAGDFADDSGEFIVRVDEKFRSRAQVVDTIIRRDGDGAFVRVADVISKAQAGYRDPFVIASVNGEDTLTLDVIKTRDGNVVKIVAAVEETLAELKPWLAQENLAVVLTRDSSVYVGDDLNTLGSNMLLGIVLVSVIIWYFMGFRNAGLTTVGIPFAFMATVLIMYFTGNSLNQITLFAFVLVTGIVVDDAIVVVENIYRHVEEGKELVSAIVDGTTEVLLPVVAATSTTVAAFLPMLIMSGTTGEFFAEIPKTITFAIVASLIECLFILPIHYLDYGPKLKSGQTEHEPEAEDNFMMRGVRFVVGKLLAFTLRFRWLTLLVVFGFFVAAIGIMGVSIAGVKPLIKIQFFPDDYTVYYVEIEGPGHMAMATVDERVRAIARAIMADGPGMAASAAGSAGFQISEDYQDVFANNIGTVIVTMPRKQDQHFADYPDNDPTLHLEAMRERLKAEFENDGFTVRVRPQNDGPPTGKDINVRILGDDPAAQTVMAEKIYQFMRTDAKIAPHLVDLQDDRGRLNRVLRFEVDQARAQEYGLDTARVALLAGSVPDGRYIGKYRVADEEIDLKLRVDPAYLDNPAAVLDIPLLEQAGSPLRLGDVAQMRIDTEAGYINRYQNQRSISLQANLKQGAPTSLPVVVKAIETFYNTIRARHPGVTVTFGGEHEDTRRSYLSLTYAFGLAILIMYLILATQFQSYLQPLIILSSVVFALIGVVFGTFISQTIFTVNSFIAIVGLTGVVVNNSLVLIDFINKRYRAGLSRQEAIAEGIRIRLRPITLTTLTTTLGLLPMALGIPDYSLVWGAMASTFVTGLATSATLTLLVVPVLWDLLEGQRH